MFPGEEATMGTNEGMPDDPGVPSFEVHEVGVGAWHVVGVDGVRRGRTLRLYLAEGPIDLVLGEQLAADLAAVLTVAHELPVVVASDAA
jgi:hypothetical protein